MYSYLFIQNKIIRIRIRIDVQDEYHIALICKYFKDVREKYVKQYYYNRLSMMKFIELMNTHNSKERFRFMLFLKIVFKLYAETL